MKKINCLLIILLFSTLGFSQETKQDTSQIFTTVETMPQFKGGEAAMIQFLTTNIKYPKLANNEIKEGRVMVGFVIEKDGSVSSTKILRGMPNAPEFETEAIRVIKLMPNWTPGIQSGKKVRTQYTLPLSFKSPK
jgi:protein TonB